jgi:hypothetical protein
MGMVTFWAEIPAEHNIKMKHGMMVFESQIWRLFFIFVMVYY